MTERRWLMGRGSRKAQGGELQHSLGVATGMATFCEGEKANQLFSPEVEELELAELCGASRASPSSPAIRKVCLPAQF